MSWACQSLSSGSGAAPSLTRTQVAPMPSGTSRDGAISDQGEGDAAVQRAATKMVELVRRHFSPEQWSKWLQTPLDFAVQAGPSDLVEALVASGADVKEGRDITPLHMATSAVHAEVVKQLLDAGAAVDVGEWWGYGRTALHKAAQFGHVGVAQLLVGAGASMSAEDRGNSTPLHLAAYFGHVVVKCLLDTAADTEPEDEDGATPLHDACSMGHRDSVQALLAAGANVHSLDNGGESSLHVACKNVREQCVEALLRFGANEPAVDTRGRTPAQVIGRSVLEDGDQLDPDEVIRIAAMLQNAPSDRAWRRRGWLVMTRDCDGEGGPGAEEAGDVDQPSSHDQQCRVAKRASVIGVTSAGGGSVYQGNGFGTGDEGGASPGASSAGASGGGDGLGEEGSSLFAEVVGRVVAISDGAEGPFRLILSFL